MRTEYPDLTKMKVCDSYEKEAVKEHKKMRRIRTSRLRRGTQDSAWLNAKQTVETDRECSEQQQLGFRV